ncbi:MAG TPA: glucosyl-3-phosphoglycerate synthase [Egibacteraceae bacterium]|nr:glucosyl-3-phosphoglycerate synthase [Egibacteraceae bacterium]
MTVAGDRDWFRRRTFSSEQFGVDALAERKDASGTTVSVVLPTRNEAATVGAMVEAVASLAGTLVDELVVVDGGSTDGTPTIAADAGARVHDDSHILPQYGPTLGKGDALWRGLSVTSGDIVVYVDADIRNPDARFVWGLLGPLLSNPAVQLVKGFYDRPLEVRGVVDRAGGGRVTELMARPLLNLFWPELAGLVQPLAGEYAGRRDLLEAVPFFTGYGVELGLLVDTLDRVGLDAIAQVDLGERIHRNQVLADLSVMAYAIAKVALRRLCDERRATLADALPKGYTQFGRNEQGRITEERRDVAVFERPPLGSVGRGGG